MAFMGLSVSATSDEPKPTDPILVDPAPVDGEVVNPCPEGVEVCAFSGEQTTTEVKVCTVDEKGNEVCEIVLTDGTPIDYENALPIDNTIDGELPPDCVADPTVCQRTDDDIKTLAPADGEYEDGIYYMTGAKDTAQDTSMVTVSVVASTIGLIALGFAANRKFRKN